MLKLASCTLPKWFRNELIANHFRPSPLGLLLQFREVSDGEWELIRPLLPPRARVGRPRADDRKVLNGILYVFTIGCRWLTGGILEGVDATR
jgi:hypothetical protein